NFSGVVSVEKGEKQGAIDLSIVIDYGTSVVDVADSIRRNVIRTVEQATGLQVIEVNIDITDVHLPNDEDDDKDSNDRELQ
ncbi:MAG: Asp23/Gls24 family envelope stress response protein, partial [Kocuria sp.]|nr:Asp23/Gls24 family envelope stress response protein [Kocuria sp.]